MYFFFFGHHFSLFYVVSLLGVLSAFPGRKSRVGEFSLRQKATFLASEVNSTALVLNEN